MDYSLEEVRTLSSAIRCVEEQLHREEQRLYKRQPGLSFWTGRRENDRLERERRMLQCLIRLRAHIAESIAPDRLFSDIQREMSGYVAEVKQYECLTLGPFTDDEEEDLPF